ncbi:MAG: hypothetical protein ABII64_01840 [Elusimicrobiota bacterium]
MIKIIQDYKWFIYLFLLSLVFALSVFPIVDPDVWWHLKTGEYIWQQKAIPSTAVFSYVIEGKPWLTFQWLSQLLFIGAYSISGFASLIFFKAFIVSLIFIFMLASLDEEANPVIAWVLFALGFIAMRDYLRERPQLFTFLFSAVYLFILRKNKLRLMYFIPVLQALWANMHGPLSLIGFGLICIYSVFSKDIPRKLKIYLPLASFAAMFANPHTYHIFTYFVSFFANGLNKIVLEYASPQISLWFALYFCLLALVIISFLPGFKKNRDAADIAIAAIGAAASLTANRNIPVFLILALPAAASRLSSFIRSRPTATHDKPEFASALRKIGLAACIGLALSAGFWTTAKKLDLRKMYGTGIGDNHPGRYAVDFLAWCGKKGLKPVIFNDYAYGGYLIWKLFPENKVFVDGGNVEYGIEFLDKTMNYHKPEIWNEFEKKYHFTAAILEQLDFYNAVYLDVRKDWVLVYWDDYALIYFKDIPENSWFIKKFGYKILKPNNPSQKYLAEYPKQQVLDEIYRSMHYAPQSNGARLILQAVEEHM